MVLLSARERAGVGVRSAWELSIMDLCMLYAFFVIDIRNNLIIMFRLV